MALDLEGVSVFPHYVKIVAGTTATEIKLPDQCDQIEIENWHASDDVYIGQNNQTDAAAWNSNNQFVIPAKNAKTIPLGRGPARATSIFVAASAGTINIYMELADK